MSTNHEGNIAECESLPLRQQTVKPQPLTFREMNDLEFFLMLLKPDVGMVGYARCPGRMDSRVVRHRQGYQPEPLAGVVGADTSIARQSFEFPGGNAYTARVPAGDSRLR